MNKFKCGDIVIGRLNQWYFGKFIGLLKGRITYVHEKPFRYNEKSTPQERLIEKWYDINVEPYPLQDSWKDYGIPTHIFSTRSDRFVLEGEYTGNFERDWEKDFDSFYIPWGSDWDEGWLYSPNTVKKYFYNLIEEINK